MPAASQPHGKSIPLVPKTLDHGDGLYFSRVLVHWEDPVLMPCYLNSHQHDGSTILSTAATYLGCASNSKNVHRVLHEDFLNNNRHKGT